MARINLLIWLVVSRISSWPSSISNISCSWSFGSFMSAAIFSSSLVRIDFFRVSYSMIL